MDRLGRLVREGHRARVLAVHHLRVLVVEDVGEADVHPVIA